MVTATALALLRSPMQNDDHDALARLRVKPSISENYFALFIAKAIPRILVYYPSK